MCSFWYIKEQQDIINNNSDFTYKVCGEILSLDFVMPSSHTFCHYLYDNAETNSWKSSVPFEYVWFTMSNCLFNSWYVYDSYERTMDVLSWEIKNFSEWTGGYFNN